jgi:hypothetical protein|uniref:Uncharacterized protein n=1 Tax=Siphoviridae sp. cthL03 TaxID=2825615 RepID=A0A8S5PF68_9CAUD|nr:MAG TPA: hypothetical protein [Siphoviridae sp. cthL03]
MEITIYELIIFHVCEWIRYRYNLSARSLVRQWVNHNTWKSRCKVKRKPTPSYDIKINITPRYLHMV